MTHGTSVAVERLREHGTQELSRLFESNRDGLRRMIGQCIHGKLSARFDASDIIQESFIRAQQQLNSYLKSAEIHPTTWLRLLCRQLLAESIRKHMRVKRSPEFEAQIVSNDLSAERLSDSVHAISKEVSLSESTEEIRQGLRLLGEEERTVIALRNGEGMTFPEIGDILNIKMETAKKRYYRAVKRLREIMKDE